MKACMYRLKTVYSRPHTCIIKIEGDIRVQDAQQWREAIEGIRKGESARQIILDFSSVSFVSPAAIAEITEVIGDGVFLMNCTTFVRNIMQSSGLGKHVLE